MADLFKQIQQYFKRDDWPFEVLAGEHALQLGFQSEETPNAWTCVAQILQEDWQFVFYSIAPVVVPSTRRAAAAEYLTRANFGLTIGNFEMDWEDGMVRFKTSIDVEDDRLSYELWRPIVYANVFVMEHYLPGLQAVVLEDAMPEDAIRRIESSA